MTTKDGAVAPNTKQPPTGGLPDPATRPTLDVWPETGNLLGLSKSSTYEAVRRGDIPTIRIGRRLLVPTAALHRLLQITTPGEAA